MNNNIKSDCTVSEAAKEAYKKMKFSRADQTNALILKINKENMEVLVDQFLENTTIDDVREELEESSLRFIVISYRWEMADGRKTYPIVFLFYNPEGAAPALNMIYSRMKTPLERMMDIQRYYELREHEDLTEQWLLERLNKK